VTEVVRAGRVAAVSLAPPGVAAKVRPAELPVRKILVEVALVVGLPWVSSSITVKALVAVVLAGALKEAEVITSLAPGPGLMVSFTAGETELA
jgi:hypothetical protein